MSSLTGSFLWARPVLTDPNFHQTVVLILADSDDGAYGVVVNRPFLGAGLPVPVFNGGPCPSPGLVMLHGHAEWVADSAGPQLLSSDGLEVAPGIYVGDASCLTRVSNPNPAENLRYRVFKGYAGWGPGQLEQEIAAGAWTVVEASGQCLFDVPADDLWGMLRPRSIPEPSVN